MKVALGVPGDVATGTNSTSPKLVARFLEEAHVTGQLDHPGIVPVHELGLDSEGRVYFTMKLVKGRELKQILELGLGSEGRVYFTMKLVKGRDLKQIFELVFANHEGWNETRALGVILKVCE